MLSNRPKLLPNLPDVVLRNIFYLLPYKYLVLCEGVCRRWMNIVQLQIRKEIHELNVERIGCFIPFASQQPAFRRLSIQSPPESYHFLAGILRRSRMNLSRITADFEFFAYLANVEMKREEKRKFFSNVEDLWLIVIRCPDEAVQEFQKIEHLIFNELQQLTIQVHMHNNCYTNVGRIVRSFVERHPKANINLELHADKSDMIFSQLRELPALPLNKIKIICTEFDLPQLRLNLLYDIMKEQNIMAKNITIRDWSLFADGTTPLAYNPLDTFRISSCTIETVDNLIKSLQMTASQERPKTIVRKKIIKKKKIDVEDGLIEEIPKKKIVKKVVKKKKVPYIKKLEIAGQCTLLGLQFLQNKAHTELEKRLGLTIPDMEVDCSEIYYCF